MKNKILVFDDDGRDFTDICDLLINEGFEVDNSLEKLQETRDNSYRWPDFNKYVIDEVTNNQNKLAGIVFDYELSEIVSTGAIETIRNYTSENKNLEETCRNIPIIGCSNSSSSDVEKYMIKAGANQFIHKCNMDKIGSALREEIKKYS